VRQPAAKMLVSYKHASSLNFAAAAVRAGERHRREKYGQGLAFLITWSSAAQDVTPTPQAVYHCHCSTSCPTH